MTAPSDATRHPRRPPGRSPNNANPVDPQSDNRPLVTITEDTQQPSITKPAQKPGRPTSFCKRMLNLGMNTTWYLHSHLV
jgi:hypothetical protein